MRAREQGVSATVFRQRVEALDLPRRYRAVFLAGPTFTLLPTDDEALAALRGIRPVLAEGATAPVPLFVPAPAPAEQIGRVRTTTAPDGAELRVCVLAEERDEDAHAPHARRSASPAPRSRACRVRTSRPRPPCPTLSPPVGESSRQVRRTERRQRKGL